MIFLLGDEFVKEGYFILLSDFSKPFTHEFFLLIVGIFLGVWALGRRLLSRFRK